MSTLFKLKQGKRKQFSNIKTLNNIHKKMVAKFKKQKKYLPRKKKK